eukprot:SAG11_NODE_16716_length_539_cov_1.552273_2_plen_36_part_01
MEEAVARLEMALAASSAKVAKLEDGISSCQSSMEGR